MSKLLIALSLILWVVTLGCGTQDTKPLVNTLTASAITFNRATLNGNLGDLGKASRVRVSFEWHTESGSRTNETTPQAMTSAGNFRSDLTGLNPATTYYFRTKAIGDGTSYGPWWHLETSRAPAEQLTILSHEMSATDFGIEKVVTGQAKNTGTNKLTYAEVEVEFKDAHGAVLRTSLDSVAGLDAGDTWSFEVMCPGRDDSNVAGYEITVGTLISSDDDSGTTGDLAAIKDTIEGYFSAWNDERWDALMSYVEDKYDVGADRLLYTIKSSRRAYGEVALKRITNINVTGSRATADVRFTADDGSDTIELVNLVNKDGSWKILL